MSSPLYEVNEVFTSIQGEGAKVGTRTTFVRFAGCNRQCSFCDTTHDSKLTLNHAALCEMIWKQNPSYIVFTGGEPMLQLDEILLNSCRSMAPCGIETNGTIHQSWMGKLEHIVISPKPGYALAGAVDLVHDMHKEFSVGYMRISEVRIVVTPAGPLVNPLLYVPYADDIYLSPMFDEDGTVNQEALQQTLVFINTCASGLYKFSIQLHKILGVR